MLGEDAISPSANAVLTEALEHGATGQQPSERAWTYRRAMDRALESMRAAK